MRTEIRYYSMRGKTGKIAKAIAEATDSGIADVSAPLEADTDILFIGGSIYGGRIHESLAEFISAIGVKVGKAVIFGSSASGKTPYEELRALLTEKGIPVDGEQFYCKGSFLFLNRGRPNAADLAEAASFAEKIIAREAEKND